MIRLRQIFSYLLIAPTVLPLVYISGVIYPYITPKTFLLQGFGIIALAIFSYLALAGQPFFYRRLCTRATWIPALLLAVTYVTSFFGVDFYHSFWGLFGRGDGLFTLTIITVFFYILLISADRQLFEYLIKTVSVVAGIVAAIAVLQWVETIFGGNASFLPPITGRIGSTFGNAAFLAEYLGMTFFVIIYAFRNSEGIWRRVFSISAVLSILAILFAATRGTILALVFAGFVAVIFYALKGDGNKKSNARIGLIAFAVVIGIFFAFRTELSQSSFEPISRIASISFSEGTISSRLFVWQNIGMEALKRPLLGYGSEHIAQIFDKVYDPSKILEQWFDRSHNSFLDYFVQYGVFGLILYLAIIGSFIAYAIKLYRRDASGGLLFLFLIITYSVQNFFVFDTPSSLWLLYALFAFIIASTLDVVPAQMTLRRLPIAVPWVASTIIAILIIPTVILPLYANILLTRGYLLHLVDVNKANSFFNQGLALGTYSDLEYGYQAYEMYTAHQAVQLKGKDLVAGYQFALSLLTDNFNKYPYDARTATYLGHVLDTAPPEVAIDDAFEEQVLSRAIELSPLRAQGWYMLANIYLREADSLSLNDAKKVEEYKKAISILETYAEKEPTLPVPRYVLTTIYYRIGDLATAKKWADEAYTLYKSSDSAAATPAVKYYLAIWDWQKAARFLADLVAENPDDYDVLYDLAKVTYLAGDPATALRIVEKLRAENPAIIATDQNFLNAITTYEQSKK